MNLKRALCSLAACFAVSLSAIHVVPVTGAERGSEDKKPSLSLKAAPPIAFSPARIRTTVDVRGGADDYQEYYCPSVEWDWGDGTVSENTEDCDPYEAGKSTIRRRYSGEHTYHQAGNYKVFFKLKRKNKVLAATSTNVQVKPGLRGDFQP
jgi:hypothetical protein